MEKTNLTKVDHIGSGYTPRSSQVVKTSIKLSQPLYSPKDACELLRISNSTLYEFIKKGILPLPIKIGPRRVAFLRGDLEAFLASRPRAEITVIDTDKGGTEDAN